VSAGGLHDTTAGEPRQVVRSHDAVELELPIAGPTSRILAYAIDAVLLYSGLLGLFFLLVLTTTALAGPLTWLGELLEQVAGGEIDPASPEQALVVPVLILILLGSFAELIYFTLWEVATGGRTPGKRALGLRVMSDGGLPLALGGSLVRNVLRLADVLPSSYLVGLVSMLVTRDGKRLGDLAAGTIVVRVDRPEVVAPLPPVVGGAPDFSISRGHLARLGGPERALVRQTLRRLETLPADQAARVLERSVEALRSKLGYEDQVEAGQRAAFLRTLWEAMSRR
jgi:uncharacterized RDD family membrane protein YckC